MNAIFKRVSVREFKDQPVEKEKIIKLMKAAMQAPSARNQQPWEFYVVTNKDLIQKLSKCSPYAGCLNNAPVAILSCFRNEGFASPAYAEIDLSIATEHILLEAVELDLGAVWLGIAPVKERMDAVRQVLKVDDKLSPFALIACGYPQKEAAQKERYEAERVHFVE